MFCDRKPGGKSGNLKDDLFMRIQMLSDLHREFGATDIPKLDSDLIILAGDISTKQNSLPWVREFCGTTPTACVCGNHEFYGDKLPKLTGQLQAATNLQADHGMAYYIQRPM